MAWRPECNEAYSKRKLRHGNWKILLGGGVGQTQLTVLTYKVRYEFALHINVFFPIMGSAYYGA
jgi:hypothetical protein